MIKFEFTVDDVDAQNIFFALNDAARKNDEHILEWMSKPDISEEQRASYIDWHQRNKEYILGLIAQMTNWKVS